MSSQMGENSQGRNRTALLVFLVGVILLLWAVGNLAYRSSVGTSEPRGESRDSSRSTSADDKDGSVGKASPDRREVAWAAGTFLLVGAGLVFLFLLGSYILIRGSRRYRARLARRQKPPSPVEDVWAMHKLPEDDESNEV